MGLNRRENDQKWTIGGRVVVSDGGLNAYPVTTATTSAAMSNFGYSNFSSTDAAKNFDLAAPEAGVRKYLFCTGASTDNKSTVVASTDNSITLNASTNQKKLVFDGAAGAALLCARSATKWDVISQTTHVTLST